MSFLWLASDLIFYPLPVSFRKAYLSLCAFGIHLVLKNLLLEVISYNFISFLYSLIFQREKLVAACFVWFSIFPRLKTIYEELAY